MHLLEQVGMPMAQLEVRIASGELNAFGQDKIQLLFSANKGMNLQELGKVASGGELSRISLAIRVVTAQQGLMPTMIFDEVDVGIGGGVAEVVGSLLKQLGQDKQVLVITHLPQVAAQGKHHLNVKKIQRDGTTLFCIFECKARSQI